jgi:hypothetical protein
MTREQRESREVRRYIHIRRIRWGTSLRGRNFLDVDIEDADALIGCARLPGAHRAEAMRARSRR